MMIEDKVNRHFLQQLLYGLPHYVFLTGPGADWIYWACSRLYAELVGSTPSDIVRKRHEELPCPMNQALSNVLYQLRVDALSGVTTEQCYTLPLASTRKKPIFIKVFPIIAPQGHVIAVVGYFYAISSDRERTQAVIPQEPPSFINRQQQALMAEIRYKMHLSLRALDLLVNYPPPFMVSEQDHRTICQALDRIKEIIAQDEIS